MTLIAWPMMFDRNGHITRALAPHQYEKTPSRRCCSCCDSKSKRSSKQRKNYTSPGLRCLRIQSQTASPSSPCPHLLWWQTRIWMILLRRYDQSLCLGRSACFTGLASCYATHATLCSSGVPTSQSGDNRGACPHQTRGSATSCKDTLHSAHRWPAICHSVPAATQETRQGRYHAVHPCHDRRRSAG